MKIKLIISYLVILLSVSNVTNATDVEPIQNAYGNVFPELTHQTLEVFRSTDTEGPWYVSFNLLATANVKVGAYAYTSTNDKHLQCCFSISSIRLVTSEGENVAFGTDTIPDNSFPESIDHLVVGNHLAAGHYAIEVSGSGNRQERIPGTVSIRDASDFITRLSVTSISPESEYEQGRTFGRQECIDKPSDCGISVTGEAVLTEELKMTIPVINWNSPAPIVLWAEMEYVPNNYTPVADDILFKVTDYGFIEK